MDIQIKQVQEWLNQTYSKVNGWQKAPTNGATGWATIYSLREALQHELGLTELGEGFGSATKAALSQRVGTITLGSKSNIIGLIRGAFWCKGISGGASAGDDNFLKYDDSVTSALKTLQGDAGVAQTGQLSVNLLAALFDMSAFVLVDGGDAKVRQIQQNLNAKYGDELGILPCDGIYQRATNTALIYALQRTLGISASVANGNFGPATIAKVPTVKLGASGDIVKIIQYGLYVNGYDTGDFDGQFSQAVGDAIVKFREFMQLKPITTTADLAVIKGLLTSNGDTNRDSNVIDTATKLTAAIAKKFKAAGYDIVGRYLTGTVGVGSAKKDKSLDETEIAAITSAGMRIFPIYEDGGYEQSYFTAAQGQHDAKVAAAAAQKLGFPSNTPIYFAVDVDILDGDMAGTVEPYVNALLANLDGYQVGIYGTRNTCLHAQKLGVKYSFVSDMSYGWSGNLGFRMPTNWAFDQFTEFTGASTGIDVDQDAASGRDNGVATFTAGSAGTSDSAEKQFAKTWEKLKQQMPFALVANLDVSWESKTYTVNTPLADMELTVKVDDKYEPDDAKNTITYSINNGTVTLEHEDDLKKALNEINVSLGNDQLTLQANGIASSIKNGNITCQQTVTADGFGFIYTIGSSFEEDHDGAKSETSYTITLKVTFHQYLASPGSIPVGVTTSDLADYNVNWANAFQDAKELVKANLEIDAVAVVIVLASLSPSLVVGAAATAFVAALAVQLRKMNKKS